MYAVLVNETLMPKKEAEPENKEEVLKLLRHAKNAKLVKPFIRFTFETDAMMYIDLKKINEGKQNNHIIKS